MTRIDFYVLPSSEAQARRTLACRLVEKAWRQGLKIFLRTDSEVETRIMDDLLWTFRQGSFIPHALSSSAAEDWEDVSVVLGHGAPPPDFRDLLINLGAETPTRFEEFGRLAEIIDQEESVLRPGRQRYRSYKEQGFSLETHNLDTSGAVMSGQAD